MSENYLRLLVLIVGWAAVKVAYGATPAPEKPKPSFLNNYYQARFINHPYHNALIAEALKQAESALGSFTSHPSDEKIPNLRIMEEVIKGEVINVFWGPALQKYARPELFSVGVPVLKGFAGCHILMIREGEQAKFTHLSSLQDITFGLDHSWAENRIFEHNKLNFITTMGVDSLFLTLKAGRNEAIPFSAHYALHQLKASRERTEGLVLEESLLLYYPMPTLYYVNRKHPALADALDRGLQALRDSGRLNQIFNEHYQAALDTLKLNQRKIITLENPFVIEDAPLVKTPCDLKDKPEMADRKVTSLPGQRYTG